MDEINDFFDFSKGFQRKLAPAGCVSGSVAATAGKSREVRNATRREYEGKEYALSVMERERIKMDQLDLNADVNKGGFGGGNSTTGASSCMDDVESLSSKDSDNEDDSSPNTRRPDDGIYDRYPFNMCRDTSLPIHSKREEIVNMIRDNAVVVLEGETGCGKTTQVPQYILDDACRRREYCKIVCTQPRRIAAISIARRVCQERKWQEGTLVGYQVGLHANLCEDTRLLYCTTGVLLQKLIREKTLGGFTHIILDEVHERDQEMDFLLIVIRRLLTTNSKQVKIILMSATINTLEFSNYFKIRREPAPILTSACKQRFEVLEYYLCDLGRINNTNAQIDFAEPGISSEMYNLALKLVIVADNIAKQEAALCLNTSFNSATKTSILIFLPGINEIDQMCKRLERLNNTDENILKLSPIRLHSLISPDEQIKVFHPAPPGYRKVILATNIAESSITVPDVKFVIDFCLTKSLVTDSASNFSSLQLQWASKANCKQRSGRAGRVMKGRVYRLVPRYYFENYMEEYCIPEMLRCPLENVILRAKLLDMGPPPDILGLAMSPPNLTDIHNTILTLKEVGALYTTVNGTYSIQDGDISFLGRVMAALPLDIRLSRLIVLGHIFSALEEAVIIAAGLSVRSIFKSQCGTPQADCGAYIQKLVFADGSGSDLFAILKAYKVWASMREQNSLRQEDSESENRWASRYFINLRSMKEMHLLIQEIKERLTGFNIKDHSSYQRVHWMDREKTIVLKIIFAGAFYPNYFTRSALNDTDRERGIYHILCGNDPCSTVYFTNFNTKQIGQLYTSYIKDLFRDVRIAPKDIEVKFQTGSEKVFVTFKSEDDNEEGTNRLVVPGKVRKEVYKAVRMRMSKMRTAFSAMDVRSSIRYAEQRGYGTMVDGVWQPAKQTSKYPDLIVLPSVFQRKLRGHITHIEHCSKFYFLIVAENERLRDINEALNDPEELSAGKFHSPAQVSKGMILSAPLNDMYRRAKVLKVISCAQNYVQFQVFFIDNGCTALVGFNELRGLSRRLSPLADIPPRIFECRLAMVQPSTVCSPNGKWSEDTKELLQECANAGIVEIEIFSVVESVSNVVIELANNTTFNNILVEKQYARKSDENYLSKTDHDFRLRKQALANRYLDEDHKRQNEEYIRSIQPALDMNVEPPPRDVCNKTIKLRGPFSPLETKIFSAVRVGTWKCVQIEKESVNSVLLDTDPQDVHERLIVAAGITESQTGETIVARSTTLMPNIHGFGALMTMLFCPTMQIKRNKSCTKYVAILAGLGYDQLTYKPLYAEHDLLLNLDVEITTEDFEMINQLRYYMDSILYTDAGDDRPNILPKLVGDVQAKIKEIIIRLLSKNRKYVEMHSDENDNVWEYHEASEILETVAVLGDRSIFPMLTALRLHDEKYDQIQALLLHCEELHKFRQMDGTVKPITCLLCNQYLENVVQIRIHLLSQLHRDREQQIRYKPRKY